MPLSLLLNWRVIARLIFTVLMAAGGWKCYVLGKNSEKVEFDVYKAEQIAATLKLESMYRAKEQSMQSTNQKVTENYESLKSATAVAVGSLDTERLRLVSALTEARGTTAYSGTGLQSNASPEDIILGGCLNQYEEVAGDAKELSDQVIGLQDYIKRVVPK